YKAVGRWNANRKLGQAVGLEAMAECMRLADEFGIGAVAVDNAFHYLWGGGYVIDAANKGYIAYTACTAALAEVVPFGGKFPTRIAALLPFGQHKGYGLALIDELLAAFIGGSLPTLRSRWGTGPMFEKHTPNFFFQCIRPDAIDCGDFALGRSQQQNVKAVLA